MSTEIRTILFYCPTCAGHVQAVIEGSYVDRNEVYGVSTYYSFGRCAKCNLPTLLLMTDNEPDELVQLFPVPIKALAVTLPPKVGESYREALKCASAQAWLATAVMVRRTLEAIGKEFKPTTTRLVDALKAMRQAGVISEELNQWGEELRFLGNISAHPTDDIVTPQDGREALEFLGAIVETIYHLRPKFQAMRERRKRAPSADPAKQEGAKKPEKSEEPS